jgi:hypothetical protein
MTSNKRLAAAWLAPLLSCVLAPHPARALGFSALVSPPRIEDSATPGQTYRNIVEITNVSETATHLTVRTADWTLQQDNGVEFSDALAAGSCRPWVGIEAPEITLGANAKRRYRFEVAVPAAAPVGECRFAIMIEGDPEPLKGDVSIPVSGRIGVIVYLAIGNAAPQLQVTGKSVRTIEGRAAPVLSVRNTGNAHGRLEGFIDGTDASGKHYAFTPATYPVMPGETRDIALAPQGDDPDAPIPTVVFPLRLNGHLESGAQRLDIDATFAR